MEIPSSSILPSVHLWNGSNKGNYLKEVLSSINNMISTWSHTECLLSMFFFKTLLKWRSDWQNTDHLLYVKTVLNDSGTRVYRTTNFFPQSIPWQKKLCSKYQSPVSFIENRAYEDSSLFPGFPISYGLWEHSTRPKEYSCTPRPQLLKNSVLNLVSARRQSMGPESAAPTSRSTLI